MVFPEYYFGQISEARHEPGTIAYSRDYNWRSFKRPQMRWPGMAARKF